MIIILVRFVNTGLHFLLVLTDCVVYPSPSQLMRNLHGLMQCCSQSAADEKCHLLLCPSLSGHGTPETHTTSQQRGSGAVYWDNGTWVGARLAQPGLDGNMVLNIQLKREEVWW